MKSVTHVCDPLCQSEKKILISCHRTGIPLLESAVALYVGMPRKQNGRPIHCIVKSSPQNAAIGKF